MSVFWLQHSQFCSFSHHSAIRSKFQNNIVHCSSEISCNPGFTYGELPHDLFLLKIHYIRGHSQHSIRTTMMTLLSFFFLYSFVSKKLADFGLRKVHLWVLSHELLQNILLLLFVSSWQAHGFLSLIILHRSIQRANQITFLLQVLLELTSATDVKSYRMLSQCAKYTWLIRSMAVSHNKDWIMVFTTTALVLQKHLDTQCAKTTYSSQCPSNYLYGTKNLVSS